jgi:hypothetical protein
LKENKSGFTPHTHQLKLALKKCPLNGSTFNTDRAVIMHRLLIMKNRGHGFPLGRQEEQTKPTTQAKKVYMQKRGQKQLNH